MKVSEQGWELLEEWLRGIARGHSRKNGGEIVDHWLRIGRTLRAQGMDDITVCGGYCHDVTEDMPHVPLDDLSAVLLAVLGNAEDANEAVELVEACSYTPEEYRVERLIAAERGKEAGKKMRKELACARWTAHPDPRVHDVKIADVNDNEADCDSVSPEFAASYRGWAVPFRDGLLAIRDARAPSRR